MPNNSNRSLFLRGVSAICQGTDKLDSGIAMVAIGACDYLNSPLVYTIGDGEDAERKSCLVHEYATKKGDKVEQGARLRAICVDLGSCNAEDIPASAMSNIARIIPAAVAISHFYGNGQDEPKEGEADTRLTLSEAPGEDGKSKRLYIHGIPAGDMFNLTETLPDGSVKLNAKGRAADRKLRGLFYTMHRRAPKDDAEMMEFVLTFPVAADGKQNDMFGGKADSTTKFLKRIRERGVAAGILPEIETRGANPKSPERKAFNDRLVQMADWVATVAKPDGETDVAPTAEQEAIMDKLVAAWMDYRTRNPVLPLEG